MINLNMKRLTLILMALLPLAAVAQKSSMTFTFTHMDAGARMVVSEAQGGRLVPVDTLLLDDKGSCRVERRSDKPAFFVVAPLQNGNLALHCILLPGEKAMVTADYRKPQNLMYVTSVKGSQNMELYRQFNNLMSDAAVDPTQQSALPARMETLLRAGSKHLMSAFLVTYFESAFEQYAPLYKVVRDDLIERYPTNEFVLHLDQKLRSSIVGGMEAPDIAMSDTAGEIRRLSDLRGKVVLIDFWASWCSPCRMENPNVVRLYKMYHDLGFEVFSVSLDNNRAKWIEAIRKDGLVWPNHVSDLRGWSSAAGKLYGISSIPSTVLVGPDGTVLARNLRGAQLEQKLKEIFDK